LKSDCANATNSSSSSSSSSILSSVTNSQLQIQSKHNTIIKIKIIIVMTSKYKIIILNITFVVGLQKYKHNNKLRFFYKIEISFSQAKNFVL
jgi:hypothetical protein